MKIYSINISYDSYGPPSPSGFFLNKENAEKCLKDTLEQDKEDRWKNRRSEKYSMVVYRLIQYKFFDRDNYPIKDSRISFGKDSIMSQLIDQIDNIIEKLVDEFPPRKKEAYTFYTSPIDSASIVEWDTLD